MKSTVQFIICFCILLGCRLTTHAQSNNTSIKRAAVAVFIPLEIDGAFNGNNYSLGNNNLPKSMLPGLDFYNGVLMAVDSLNKLNTPIDVIIIDSKQKNKDLSVILQDSSLQTVSLIIGAITSKPDTKIIADFAATNHIPFISAIFPNDAGVTANPYFTILNPTLKTQCEAISNYLQNNFAKNTILYCKKKGATEDYIQTIISGSNSKQAISFLNIELQDSVVFSDLIPYLDSTKQNILMCGSLKESFGAALVKVLNENPTYKTVVIGMPTWDGLKTMDMPNVEIIYASPYYFNGNEKLLKQLTANYKLKYLGRPSDQFFKGYETMLYFTNSLFAKSIPVFNSFKINPVLNTSNKSQIDYQENKNLYFFRKQNGQIKTAKPYTY
jgi:ABC-type branched-subunit amino acid transport system substrate-binding protein